MTGKTSKVLGEDVSLFIISVFLDVPNIPKHGNIERMQFGFMRIFKDIPNVEDLADSLEERGDTEHLVDIVRSDGERVNILLPTLQLKDKVMAGIQYIPYPAGESYQASATFEYVLSHAGISAVKSMAKITVARRKLN